MVLKTEEGVAHEEDQMLLVVERVEDPRSLQTEVPLELAAGHMVQNQPVQMSHTAMVFVAVACRIPPEARAVILEPAHSGWLEGRLLEEHCMGNCLVVSSTTVALSHMAVRADLGCKRLQWTTAAFAPA
jgi:hypothetical protein